MATARKGRASQAADPPRLKVWVAMGSDSDLPVMEEALKILREFDIPFEVDWFRFSVPPPENGSDTQLVTISWSPQPFGASDLNGLYLLVQDASIFFGDTGDWLAAARPTSGGGTLQFEAFPGDYYLVVGDAVGAATRYGLCMARGATCSPPERPPE